MARARPPRSASSPSIWRMPALRGCWRGPTPFARRRVSSWASGPTATWSRSSARRAAIRPPWASMPSPPATRAATTPCSWTPPAATGQNALARVPAVDDALQLTGLIVTKLDGTAKGGVLAAIAQERPIPVYFIGVGEKLEDLETFNAREFSQALLD